MAFEAVEITGGADKISVTLETALSAGEVRQLADGRAGVFPSFFALAAGASAEFRADGKWTMPKIASKVCLDGFPAWWDHANNYVTPLRPISGRGFKVGSFIGDAASADTTCAIALNITPRPQISLRDGEVWTNEATNGLGTTPLLGGGFQMAFDAVAEAAQAANYSARTVPIAGNPMMRARVCVADNGDNAALDIDIGFANASHATNFESIAEFVAFHYDGNALDIFAHSDDGTTDVAPTDTTVNFVEGTYHELWIDARTPTDIQMYIDGVLVLGATVFTLGNATGPIFPIVNMEKTSDDTLADFRVAELDVYFREQ